MDAPFCLHDEIQRQRQQCVAALLLAVSGNEQQKNNDDQIPSVKIPGQQLLQKTPAAFCILTLRRRWLMGQCFCWSAGRFLPMGTRLLWWRALRFFYSLVLKRAVRLRNITVIHDITCLS